MAAIPLLEEEMSHEKHENEVISKSVAIQAVNNRSLAVNGYLRLRDRTTALSTKYPVFGI
jgi:hypothetical protein